MNEQELLTRLKRAELALDLVGNIFQDAMRLLAQSKLLKFAGGHEQVASMAFAVYQKLYFEDRLFADQKEMVEELKSMVASDPDITPEAMAAIYRLLEELYL